MILTCGSPEEERRAEKMRQSNFKKDLDAFMIRRDKERLEKETFFGMAENEILLN